MAKQKGNLRQEDVESFLMDESSSDDNIENYLPNGGNLLFTDLPFELWQLASDFGKSARFFFSICN